MLLMQVEKVVPAREEVGGFVHAEAELGETEALKTAWKNLFLEAAGDRKRSAH